MSAMHCPADADENGKIDRSGGGKSGGVRYLFPERIDTSRSESPGRSSCTSLSLYSPHSLVSHLSFIITVVLYLIITRY